MSHSSLPILDIFTFLKDYLLTQMKLKLKSNSNEKKYFYHHEAGWLCTAQLAVPNQFLLEAITKVTVSDRIHFLKILPSFYTFFHMHDFSVLLVLQCFDFPTLASKEW